MFFRPRLGFVMQPLDERLELLAVDPPHPSPPYLDRGELAGPDKRVDLRDAHAQVDRHVVERQEARVDLGPLGPLITSGIRAGHVPRITAVGDGYMDLGSFALVWPRDDSLRAASWRC